MSRVKPVLVVLAVLLAGGVASARQDGYIRVDKKKVGVPFHVVHGLFDFQEAQRLGLQAVEPGALADGKSAIEWLGRLRPGAVYVGERMECPERTADETAEAWRKRCRKMDPVKGVQQIVLHYTGTYRLDVMLSRLVMRGLSVHFVIDSDGTVYQLADLALRTEHTRHGADRSIGIDLVNPASPSTGERAYDARKDGLVALSGLQRSAVKGVVHGKAIETTGYTAPQVASLHRLTRALVDVFPNLPAAVPKTTDGKAVTGVLNDALAFRGVLGHFHLTTDRSCPGPTIDWIALEKALKE